VLWLPQEICDNILDHLWDDRETLKICSLASRAWLNTTRLHIFRTVHIPSAGDYKSFKELLDHSPEIGPCVRELCLGACVNDPEVLTMLLVMNNVEDLKIRQWDTSNMADEIRRDPAAYLRSLKRLHLVNVQSEKEDLPRIICACPSLSTLDMSHVFWQTRIPLPALEEPAKSAMVPPRPIAIEELSVEVSSIAVLLWLLEGPLSLCLRRLTLLRFDRVHTTYIRRLLDGSAEALEHLSIAANLEGLDNLDLARHTRLRSLSIDEVDVDGRRRQRPEGYTWILSLLSHLDSTHLQEIRMGLRLLSPADVSVLQWADIDEQLARLARKQDNLTVRFRAYNAIRGHAFTDQVLDTIVSRIPILRSTGALVVVTCVNTRGASGVSDTEQEFRLE